MVFSPTSQAILDKFFQKAGYGNYFLVDSAGLNPSQEGVFSDLETMRCASTRGYSLTTRSRKMSMHDFDKHDYVIVIGNHNFQAVYSLVKEEEQKSKILNIVDFCTNYYLLDFPKLTITNREDADHLIDILEDACAGIMEYVTSETFESY